MAPVGANRALDPVLEGGRREGAPAGYAHDVPRGRSTPPTVIVRAGHDRQAKRVRERENARVIAIAITQTAWRGIGDFDGCHRDDPRHARARDAPERTGDGLNHHRACASRGDRRIDRGGREVATLEQRVVGRGHTEHVDVFTTFETFDRAE